MLLGFVLCVLWCGLLIRTWACCSESGQPRPCTGQAARVRNRRPACGIGGPRVKEGVQPYTRLAAMRASSLCGAWAFSSARGPAVPSLGDPAHVRDRWPACGTGGPRAGHVGVQVVVACGQSAFALVADGCTTPSVGIAPLPIGCSAHNGCNAPLMGVALPNGCNASRVTAALPIVQVPVSGGPPARSPHASLRLGVIDLEARPGPAAAPGHRFCPRVPQPSLLLPSEPGGCCGGMRQAAAVFDRCGIVNAQVTGHFMLVSFRSPADLPSK